MAPRRDAYEAQHAKNRVLYEKKIKQIFTKVCYECGMSVTQLASIVENAGKNANFAQIPAVRTVLDKLQRRVAKELNTAVIDGVKAEWKLANDKYDALIGTMAAGDLLEKMDEAAKARTMARNLEARDAFLERKEGGLNLSQRVWQYSGQMRDAMEVALELGISEGESAAEIARDLKQYLVYPDKLFRRVRNEETGELKISKPASMFHPGQGVYRSSYKNALRLALNETNIAYRKADSIRRVGLSFIVGIEVHLSNNHNCVGVPEGQFHDICDELQGKYPPDFEFVGWHPNCRCWTSTIHQTDDEFIRDSDGIYRGSVNEVKDVPPQFKKWLEENKDRIERSEANGTLPYFLHDNQWAWKEDAERPNEKKVNTALQTAEQRHEARTPEQVRAIKDRWKERNLAVRNANRARRLIEVVPGMREYVQKSWPEYMKVIMGEKPFGGKYVSLYHASRMVIREMSDLKKSLSLLDKPWEVLKEHGVEKSIQAQKAVRDKMAQWSGQSLEYQLKKLRFEAKWIEENKKGVISTWKVAQDAYLKAAREVEWRIEWEPILNELKALAKNPYADKDMIAEVRSYVGKDKDEAEYALSHLKIDTERNEIEAKWEAMRNEAPQIFSQEFVEGMRNALNEALDQDSLNEARQVLKVATLTFDRWRTLKGAAEQYLGMVAYDSVKEELRSAIAAGTIDALTKATDLAQRAVLFKQQSDKALALLMQYREALSKLNPYMLTKLDERIVPKKFGSSEVVALNLAYNQAKGTIDNWNNEVVDFNVEYGNYATSSNDYKKLVKEAQKAIADFDLNALKDAKQKLADKKAALEKEKAYWAGVDAEWEKMYNDTATVQSAINESDELDKKAADSGIKALISEFDANYNGPRKLREARKVYKEILEKAKALGIELDKNIIKYDKSHFTKEAKDKAPWNITAGEADDYFHQNAVDFWPKLTQAEKQALWGYTSGSSYITEPLRAIEGHYYAFKGRRDRTDEHIRAMTAALAKHTLSENVWIKRDAGSWNIDYIFGVKLSELRDDPSSLVGKVGREDSFQSCGSCKETRFTCTGEKDVILNIYCPAGTFGAYAQPWSSCGTYGSNWDGKKKSNPTDQDENEVLLQRGAIMRITKAEWNKMSHKWYIDVEIIGFEIRDFVIKETNEGYYCEFKK